jgi:hypothetical protein
MRNVLIFFYPCCLFLSVVICANWGVFGSLCPGGGGVMKRELQLKVRLLNLIQKVW